VPAPPNVEAERWLTAFPSFGFLLCAEPENEQRVRARFEQVGVTCARVGTLEPQPTLTLCCEGERAVYWDLEQRALTGFGSRRVRASNA
jgi:selenophosphate synthetase-related protein